MSLFSERYGYVTKPVQLESITSELRNRIWNIYSCEVCTDCAYQNSNYMEELMDFFGLTYKSVYDTQDIENNLKAFKDWYMNTEWYKVYDFIEAYLAFLSPKSREDAMSNFNDVLEWENSGYRIVGRLVTPITNENEIQSIEAA